LFVCLFVSYIILRGPWCHIFGLNVHARTEDKIDNVKSSFYQELERTLDKFPKYHKKILFENFSAKIGTEDIFKPITWNESLRETNNDKGLSVVSFATSETKSGCSHNATLVHFLVHRLMERHSFALRVCLKRNVLQNKNGYLYKNVDFVTLNELTSKHKLKLIYRTSVAYLWISPG
jgi:hypothetical protein